MGVQFRNKVVERVGVADGEVVEAKREGVYDIFEGEDDLEG